MQTYAIDEGVSTLKARGGDSDIRGISLNRGDSYQELAPSSAERRATGLGWFSIGLGLAELLVPGAFARLIGARDRPVTRITLMALGVREIATGVGILMQRRPAELVWGRVVGDLTDLALLSRTLVGPGGDRGRTIAATAAVLGVTAIDAATAMELGRGVGFHWQPQRGIHVTKSITIGRPRDEVYRFWRDFTNLPVFMAHLESVEILDGRSRWRAKAPAGMKVEWDAEILQDEPGEIIRWRSLAGAEVPNQGTVKFVDAPGGRGTIVRVELVYDPPAGILGAAVAKLFGEEPEQQIEGDLRRLKQVLETGEVVHSDASIHRGPHAAQPSESFSREGKRVIA